MQTGDRFANDIHGRQAVLQINDGSHSFLRVCNGRVTLESVALGYDIVQDASLVFEIQSVGRDRIQLVCKSQPSTRLAFGEYGHLALSPPAGDDATSFHFTAPASTLPLLPVLLSGVGKDGRSRDLIVDALVPAGHPKFPKQLALRLVHPGSSDLRSSIPAPQPLQGTSVLPPFLPAPVQASIGAGGPASPPFARTDSTSSTTSAGSDLGAHPTWAASLVSKKAELDQWCLNTSPTIPFGLPVPVARLMLTCNTVLNYLVLQPKTILYSGAYKVRKGLTNTIGAEKSDKLMDKVFHKIGAYTEVEKLNEASQATTDAIKLAVEPLDLKYEVLCDFVCPLEKFTASAYGSAFYRTGPAPFIIIAMKGTTDYQERLVNFQITQMQTCHDTNLNGSLHSGFYSALFKCQNGECADEATRSNAVIPIDVLVQRVEEIIRNIRKTTDSRTIIPMFVTGHSLGGALGTVVYSVLRGRPLPPNVMLRDLITYGSPRVGDAAFSQSVLLDKTRPTPFQQWTYRIVNRFDLVASVPGRDWKDASQAYQHIEQGLRIGTTPGRFDIIPKDVLAVGEQSAESMKSVLTRLKNLWLTAYANDQRERPEIYKDMLDHFPAKYWESLQDT